MTLEQELKNADEHFDVDWFLQYFPGYKYVEENEELQSKVLKRLLSMKDDLPSFLCEVAQMEDLSLTEFDEVLDKIGYVGFMPCEVLCPCHDKCGTSVSNEDVFNDFLKKEI